MWEAVSLSDYYHSCEKLKNLGFIENKDVICRWEKNDLILDFMPSNEKVLGFGNPWYEDILKHRISTSIDDMTIYHVSAPYFVASKLEAYNTRGNNDPWSSHDLEDIISVVDGRSELLSDILMAERSVMDFLKSNFTQLLNNSNFMGALPGYLPPDVAGQARLESLKEKLKKLSKIE